MPAQIAIAAPIAAGEVDTKPQRAPGAGISYCTVSNKPAVEATPEVARAPGAGISYCTVSQKPADERAPGAGISYCVIA